MGVFSGKKTTMTSYFKTWDAEKTTNEKCVLRENNEPHSVLWDVFYISLCLVLEAEFYYLQP